MLLSGLHPTNCARVVKYVSFITLWHKHCSNIKIQPARNDLRDKCDQMLVTLRHSLSDEQRKTINDKYTQHLIKAKAFRDAYTFRFDRKHPGVMKMKTLPSDANPTEVTMLRAGVAITDIKDAYQSQVMPPVITPPALSMVTSVGFASDGKVFIFMTPGCLRSNRNV